MPRAMMSYLATLLASFFVLLTPLSAGAAGGAGLAGVAGVEEARFEADGLTLSGVLTTPPSGQAKSLVILVHGYGETSVVEKK